MILDVAALRELDDALTVAHREPQACGHPKADLRICARCVTVLCGACDMARLSRCEKVHVLLCGGTPA